jgi:hypothetical protein
VPTPPPVMHPTRHELAEALAVDSYAREDHLRVARRREEPAPYICECGRKNLPGAVYCWFCDCP